MALTSPKTKVYIKTNENSVITRCEGGFTEPKDLNDWICIDEGTGTKYYLCQSHYFDGGLYTPDMIPRWKLEDDKPVLRTDAELEADRKNRPAPPPDPVTQIQLAVAELAQTMEEQNTLNQLAIAELAEVSAGGK